MNWFQHQRQEWIAETLRVFGFIQRQHIAKKFGVSIQLASQDLHRYQRTRGRLVYDASVKRYVRPEEE